MYNYKYHNYFLFKFNVHLMPQQWRQRLPNHLSFSFSSSSFCLNCSLYYLHGHCNCCVITWQAFTFQCLFLYSFNCSLTSLLFSHHLSQTAGHQIVAGVNYLQVLVCLEQQRLVGSPGYSQEHSSLQEWPTDRYLRRELRNHSNDIHVL